MGFDVKNGRDDTDDFIRALGEQIARDESGVSIANKTREREFQVCAEYLKKTVKGRGVKIQCVPHDGYASVGVIRILANDFTVMKTDEFAAAVKLASNYEIYPRTDGKVMFALTFYGMTKKVRA